MSVRRHVYPSQEEAAQACAVHCASIIEEALSAKEFATVAISGGSTPRLMFAALAKMDLPWKRIHWFWVDERAVPPGQPQSNFSMAEQYLLRPARVPQPNIHRIHAELGAHEAAAEYVTQIRRVFGLAEGELPHFDLMQRGVGADAHTASLFPGEPLIEDRVGIAASVFVEKFNQWRITLLPGVLLAAAHTAMLVCGADKKDAVRDVLLSEYDPMRFPAQIVSHHGRSVHWFLDEPAAAALD